MAEFDLAIIGGGINGVGLARDAAGRGLRVVLVEQGDLASGTSSASTKLIHGGLRYLEQFAFRLVREALAERTVLMRAAPHLVRPMRFILPVAPQLRAPWLLRLGLFLYDHLGARRTLPPACTLDLAADPCGAPLDPRHRRAFAYSDCRVDDSRLVILNAVDAAARGTLIRTRTRCIAAARGAFWQLSLDARGRAETVTARALVNAAGPWAAHVDAAILGRSGPTRLRLVKGSHIVVRRLFDHSCGYVLQAADRRIVFALPFARDFTLIGTTDADFEGAPEEAAPSPAEIDYLCTVANGYFRRRIAPADVIWAFAGVRALRADDTACPPQDASRDYALELDAAPRLAPLLTVHGGKLTTYRRLAEAALTRLAPVFGARPAWTAEAPLPGGDFPVDGLADAIARTRTRWPFLPAELAERLVLAYGTRVGSILGEAASLDALGPFFGPQLSAAEVRYLVAQEWAETPEDILWRRSKLGLTLAAEDRAALGRLLERLTGRQAAVSPTETAGFTGR